MGGVTSINSPPAIPGRFNTLETHEDDKAWEMVHHAQNLGWRISPEVMDRLKKASGRTN